MGGCWGLGTSHITVVCSSAVAALALCPGVQQGEISGLSPFRSCIQSTWGFFALWFYTDGPALESGGLSCRHRKTCRNQDSSSFGRTVVMLAAPGSLSLRHALGSRTRQQSKKQHKAP